jgi:hypothetical protein
VAIVFLLGIIFNPFYAEHHNSNNNPLFHRCRSPRFAAVRRRSVFPNLILWCCTSSSSSHHSFLSSCCNFECDWVDLIKLIWVKWFWMWLSGYLKIDLGIILSLIIYTRHGQKNDVVSWINQILELQYKISVCCWCKTVYLWYIKIVS